VRLRILAYLLPMIALGLSLPAAASVFVRMYTPLGDIDLELFDTAAPAHVQNFLNYMERRDYDDTFIHRSVVMPQVPEDFVIQGGGYWPNLNAGGFVLSMSQIPHDPPVTNNYNQSNLRGTIAMARVAGDVNSATSEWFINLTDNPELDTDGGVGNGFTVFGKVINNKMTVVDAIANLQVFNGAPTYGSPFGQLPLNGYLLPNPVHHNHLVFLSRTVLVADNQCGDMNDDHVVDDYDYSYFRYHLADAAFFPLALDQCSVTGTTACDLVDWVVLRRDFALRGPGMTDACSAANP
jgi:cyclophilin family peptidyl-prolyl cis-trans isomerase